MKTGRVVVRFQGPVWGESSEGLVNRAVYRRGDFRVL